MSMQQIDHYERFIIDARRYGCNFHCRHCFTIVKPLPNDNLLSRQKWICSDKKCKTVYVSKPGNLYKLFQENNDRISIAMHDERKNEDMKQHLMLRGPTLWETVQSWFQ